jgi:predicted dehydrogenase
MADEDIRVGLIGAGGNVRNRHIPGFRKVKGVEIVGVVNRSLESSQRVADQFNIPRVYNTWQELLDDDEINAICIGTWPYMHRPLTLAALEQGKHVLTEARMASTAQEARDMLAASRSRPQLVCQLTPTSTTYRIDRVLQRLIGEGFLGELLSVEIGPAKPLCRSGGELHWRHDWELSGTTLISARL